MTLNMEFTKPSEKAKLRTDLRLNWVLLKMVFLGSFGHMQLGGELWKLSGAFASALLFPTARPFQDKIQLAPSFRSSASARSTLPQSGGLARPPISSLPVIAF